MFCEAKINLYPTFLYILNKIYGKIHVNSFKCCIYMYANMHAKLYSCCTIRMQLCPSYVVRLEFKKVIKINHSYSFLFRNLDMFLP